MTKLTLFVITFLNIFLYVLVLIITRLDTHFSYVWLTFVLWLLPIFILFFFFILFPINKRRITKKGSGRNELLVILLILLLAFISRLVFIRQYPFVAVGDEISDTGLLAQRIIGGEIKNIHGWGRYDDYGLIIPTITGFFYLIFKNSVLTYRIPAAISSVANILLLYFLTKKLKNNRTAFWAALILINLPIHLYYSRTEALVIFDSLLTTVILLSVYLFLKNGDFYHHITLGALLGFCAGFHAGVRTIVIITLPIAIFIDLKTHLKKSGWLRTIKNFMFLIIFFWIGFGPRIIFTTPKVFFRIASVSLLKEEKIINPLVIYNALAKNIGVLGHNYLNSVAVYFIKPVLYPYQYGKPILSIALGLFFVVGFLYLIIYSKDIYSKLLCFYALSIPATNSALTDYINRSNRLGPLLPISALIAAIGINQVVSKIELALKHPKRFISIFQVIFILYLLIQGYNFFAEESGSRTEGGNHDYLSAYTINILKTLPSQKQVCLKVSPENFNYLNYLHIREQHLFFLPDTEEIIESENIPDNDIYISRSCSLEGKYFIKYEYCAVRKKFICPLTGGQINLFVDESLVIKS